MATLLRTRSSYLLLYTLLGILLASCGAPQTILVRSNNFGTTVGGMIGTSTGTSTTMLNKSRSTNKQQRTWKRSSLLANKVQIKIGDKKSLPIQSMRASIKIDGFRARVILDYHFYNDNNRPYEATFQLRLPNGASPYYLAFGESIYQSHSPQFKNKNFYPANEQISAFDSKQIQESYSKTTIKLREARMVTRAKAVRAYHNTVHKRVDPALLEWSGSGVFNGRLFPIQANKLHRVVIAYDVDLRQTPSHYHFNFPLPNKIKHKQIHFDVATIKGSRLKLKNHYNVIAKRKRTVFSVKNPKDSHLQFTIKRSTTTVVAGVDRYTKRAHFALRLDPRLTYRKSKDNKPEAVFLIDISLSNPVKSFNRSLKLMNQILATNQKNIKKFAVLFFNARSFWWRKTYSENNSKQRQTLLQYANTLSLQGASDIDLALNMATKQPLIDTTTANLYLISDGSTNWGETRLNAIARKFKHNFKNKLFAYSTATTGVNATLLSRLSSISNGAYYTVNNDKAISKAAIAIQASSWKIKKLQVTHGRDIIIQGNPSQIYPGQILTIAGRGQPKAGDIIKLTISNGLSSKVKKYRITHNISSSLAGRLYGITAVNLMESLQQERDNTIIQSYALHYRVIGQNTSLLMLESERDYQRYNIKPKDNIRTIRQTSASYIIKSLLRQQRKAALSDKQLFISMLNHLKHIDGVTPVMSAELKTVIGQLPTSAFTIKFKLPTDYQAVNLLAKNRENKHDSESLDNSNSSYESNNVKQVRPAQAIDIKSDKAYQLIIDKYKSLAAKKQPSRALVALSSLLELNAGKVKHMRLVSYYLLQMKQYRDAWFLFQQISQKRPHEAPAYIALARIAENNKQWALASLYYEILLNAQWDNRYRYVTRLATIEYKILLRKMIALTPPNKRSNKVSYAFLQYATKRLSQLSLSSNQTNSGLMVAIEWNTMGADIDLHIKTPKREHLYYSRRQASNGATLENDDTSGMGPEIFRSAALHGTYKVGVKYFSNNSTRKTLRTAILMSIYRNIGSSQASVERKVIVLRSSGEVNWLKKFRAK
ncbi:hypothetical protein MNBD_GAMMA12-983 [hydrothermal vent metagenome]|uniref:VWFA domain-containing protein n=1 Tax=hydrothermal vent metagenome TaxID=652676 RepID=A0A3B0YQX5_9ZZZZ